MDSNETDTCTHLALLPGLPTDDQLVELRRGFRRRKTPALADGTHGSHPILGKLAVTGSGENQSIAFRFGPSGKLSKFKFVDLCDDPKLQPQRLRLGWLLANMLTLDAMHVRDQIGHPIEALQATAAQDREADNWRHWAIAPPALAVPKKTAPKRVAKSDGASPTRSKRSQKRR